MNKLGEKITKPIVLSSVFGFLAAVVGTFVIISFLMPGGVFLKNADIEGQNQEFLRTSLGIKAYGRLEVFEFLDKALPSVAGIYKKKAGASFLDRLYLSQDRLGFGFVLTADGWIITTKSVVDGWGTRSLSVAINNKIYNVTEKVYDTWTDAVFLKTDAKKLPVVSIGNSEALKLGDIVFTGAEKNNFWFGYVSALNFYPETEARAGVLLSSEKFGKVIKIQGRIPDEFDGGMISNKAGEVVGVIVANSGSNHIIPVNYFKNVINDVLKNQKISRPYLGVTYIDLSFALAEELPNSRGAYIYGGGLLRSVETNSPAFKSGLKTGDIIVAADNTAVGDYKNLAEIIYEYSPGSEINLKVLREGAEQEVKVKLE